MENGAASRWWLRASLESLDAALEGKLQFYRGPAQAVLPQLARQLDASHVFWNRCYEPWRIDRDRRIMRELRDDGRSVSSKNGSLLFEPQSVTKPDGSPYRVFTPYFRKGCLNAANTPRDTLPVPQALRLADSDQGGTLDELALLPAIRWSDDMAAVWSPGEAGSRQRLAGFLDHGLQNYKAG